MKNLEATAEELKELKDRKNADQEAQKQNGKAKWSNDLEFLCSCITLSVGLGNVWRYLNVSQFCEENSKNSLQKLPNKIIF
jgi:Sodium:neurotransmitter symporter family